jgi:uncharacterized membrane protein
MLFLPGEATRLWTAALALVGAGFSAYLTYLELFVIDAICQWCVISAVLMGLSLLIAAARAFAYTGAELAPPPIQSTHGR